MLLRLGWRAAAAGTLTDCTAVQSRFGLSTSPASAEPLRAWKAVVSGTCAQIQVHARAAPRHGAASPVGGGRCADGPVALPEGSGGRAGWAAGGTLSTQRGTLSACGGCGLACRSRPTTPAILCAHSCANRAWPKALASARACARGCRRALREGRSGQGTTTTWGGRCRQPRAKQSRSIATRRYARRSRTCTGAVPCPACSAASALNASLSSHAAPVSRQRFNICMYIYH